MTDRTRNISILAFVLIILICCFPRPRTAAEQRVWSEQNDIQRAADMRASGIDAIKRENAALRDMGFTPVYVR